MILDKKELIKRRIECLEEEKKVVYDDLSGIDRLNFDKEILAIGFLIDWINEQDLPRNVLDGNIVRDAAIQLNKLLKDSKFTTWYVREECGMNIPTTESIMKEGNVGGFKYDLIGKWIRENK